MNNSESNSNHSNAKNLAMGVVVLTVISTFFFLVYSGLFEQGYQLILNQINPNSNYVTYYQWTDNNGEMKISRDPPHNREYITFEADEQLQQVNYQLDTELIHHGQQVKEELLEDSSDNQRVQQKNSALQKARNLANNQAECAEINKDINSLEFKLKQKWSASQLDFYQTELSQAKWRKLKNRC